jgi:Spy/CpxP family protein refolding chaperone
MAKTKIIIVICFAAAFVAGAATGWLAKESRRPPRDPSSWLTRELNLTTQQQEQMRKIWSEVMETSPREYGEKRRAIAEERNKAIVALLSDQQKAKYDQILADYNRKITELSEQRKAAFDQAVERTKQILTPDQAKKYDELMKRQRERGGPGPGGPRPWGGPPHQRHGGPRGTMPTTDESRTIGGGE